MHKVLVIAGWWTALSLCAVPVWAVLMRRGRFRGRRTANASDPAPKPGATNPPASEQSA